MDASRRTLLLGAGVLGAVASVRAAATAAPAVAAPTVAAAAPAQSAAPDIRDYLLDGETLDQTGVVSMHVIFQRAVDALTAVYASTGVPQQIHVPNGRYQMTDTLTWRTGVGLVGESRQGCIFYAPRTLSFITGSYPPRGYTYDDCHFADFTVDGVNQASEKYSTGIKGIFIQYMRRARFDRVTVKNTFATGFGVDHLQEAAFTDCRADNCGRGIKELGLDPRTVSGGSGFGIGTGGFPVEDCSISDCVATNNGLHGIFSEKQKSDPHYPQGFRVSGCFVSGNWIGFRDCGSTGAVVVGNQFVGNLYCGVSLDKTILAANAGLDGLIVDNVISGNGAGAAAFSVTGAGVVVGAAALGGYTVRGNEIHGNVGAGIDVVSTAAVAPYYSVDGNRVHHNGGAGISIGAASSQLHVVNNTTWSNASGGITFTGFDRTATGLLSRNNTSADGIVYEQTLIGATRTGNLGEIDAPVVVVVTDLGATTVTLAWSTPAASTSPVTGYHVDYQPAGGGWETYARQASTTTTVQVTGLTGGTPYGFRVTAFSDGAPGAPSAVVMATPGMPVVVGDLFGRADSTSIAGQTASDGTRATSWAVANQSRGTATMGISATQLKATGTGSASAYAVVDTAAGNGRLRITAATLKVGSTRKTGALFRYVDARNHWRIACNHENGGYRWRLAKLVDNVVTVAAETPVDAAAGDVLAVTYSGADISFSVNGGLVGSVTDPTFSSATRVGAYGATQDVVSGWRDLQWYA